MRLLQMWGLAVVLLLGWADRTHAVPSDARRPSVATDTTALAYARAPLRTVLADIEAQTNVRFLYRDALVAGVNVSLQAPISQWARALNAALRPLGLHVVLDASGQQAILIATSDRASPATLRGYVLDAATGARLPYATVSWWADGALRGTVANGSGLFQTKLRGVAPHDTLHLRVSYVGHQPARVVVRPQQLPRELAVRLQPKPTQAPAVTVHSVALQSPLNDDLHALVRPGRMAPLGEASVLHALEMLPSATLGPTLGRGLSMRGSPPDAFRVLLDGAPMYATSHLFGLFDAYSGAALQAVGFYYGVPPATYAAAPGGVLALKTQAGDQTATRLQVGASNTALQAMAEGPVAGGHGSWLVAARHSYLNAVDWLGNAQIVRQGLGINPRMEAIPADRTVSGPPVVQSEARTARFYDVHAKGLWETDAGGRFALGVYVGGDEAQERAQRVFLVGEDRRDRTLQQEPVDANHAWGNESVGVQSTWPLSDRLMLHTTAAGSYYHARLLRDDFIGVGFRTRSDPVRWAYRYTLRNTLFTGRWAQQLAWMPTGPGTWTMGYDVRMHRGTLTDAVDDDARYRLDRTAWQADAHVEWAHTVDPLLDVRAGLRGQFFSLGSRAQLAPRVAVRLYPQAPLTLGIGYSRTHQFLHRLALTNDSIDLWAIQGPRTPPTTSDQWTAGVYWTRRPSASYGTTVQVEGYRKTQHHLWQYTSFTQRSVLPQRGQGRPFTTANTVTARGLEVLAQQHVGPVTASASYTWARAQLHPPSGGSRPAPWDRRHQATARLEARVGSGLTLFSSAYYGTGVPNTYAALPGEPARLRPYHRLDVGAALTATVNTAQLTAQLTVHNIYNRDNPWYRTPVLAIEQSPLRAPGPAIAASWTGATVYDLGLQPAFSFSIQW